MSIHPSLKTGKSKKHKSVLKRLERMLSLQKEDKWTEEDSVFGLPKVKVVRLKIKKEKAKAPEAAEAAAGEVAAAGVGVPAAEGAKTKAETKPEGKAAPEKKPTKEKHTEKKS